jgi:outer membrane protein assembly factor BamB
MYRDGTLSSLLITGFNGRVIALDRASGKEVWRFDSGHRHVTVELHVETDVLFVAAGRLIVLLDPETGAEIRRTEIESELQGVRPVMLVEPDAIYVSHGGVTTCLERDGTLRWTNELTGTGYGDPSLAVTGRTVRTRAHRD